MRYNIGIYNLHMDAMGGGEKLTLELADHLSLTHNVQLFSAEPLERRSLEKFFGVDLSRVTVSTLNSGGPFLRVAEKVLDRRGPAFSIDHYRQIKKLKLDLFINNSYASRLRCPAEQGIFMCMFPRPMTHSPSGKLSNRIRAALTDTIENRNSFSADAIDSYSTVVAISQYSADWISRMWKVPSQVIYPPCEDMGPPATKTKTILNVGRIVAGTHDEARHDKQQAILLEAFKEMTELHRDGWELHFAGSVGRDEASKRFADSLKESTVDFPAFFHTNLPRDEMRGLYRRAAIYWHATGLGFDTDTHPAKQEHFGMATVEAMSAGAVPVVFPSGGQKEIVTDGFDGVWWHDLDELQKITQSLANDSVKRRAMSVQAVRSSKRYGKNVFTAKVDLLIEHLLLNRG